MDESSELSICDDVYNEFSAWNKKHSERMLDVLCRGSAQPQSSATHTPIYDREAQPADFTIGWFRRASLVMEYPTEHKVVDESAGGLPIIEHEASVDVAPHLDAFPAYESCAPVASSTWKGDDSDVMPFIPFSDQPAFNYDDDQYEYNELGWQRETLKADGEH
jgi:hypothetical protein